MALEYKLSKNEQGWENGSWVLVVVNNGGDPNYNNGQIIGIGTYKMTETCNGELFLDMHNIDFKRGNWTEQTQWSFSGDLIFTYSVTNTTTVSTSNGIDAVFKPNWDVSPMNAGDSWKQADELTENVQSDYSWTGDFTGGDTGAVTKNYVYDFIWTVESKAQKTISNTWKGSTTFQDGYEITRSGKYDWDVSDGSNSDSGTTTTGPYALWYAGDGDNFDACGVIDFNGTSRIIYSTCTAFVNTRPHFDYIPASDIDINSEAAWDFKEGVDYTVSDPDPGPAGQLTYTLKTSLPDHTNVLTDMTIDPNTGEINYTPTQKDVAEGYQITINVSDNYEKGKLSTEATFTLNINNKNHAPMINKGIISNITIQEGDSYTPTWRLSEAFHDVDMDANPLMGNASYDPNENLTFSVINNGSIRVVCPNGKDRTISNQCVDLRFIAIDGKFPRDQTVTMTAIATDKYGQKVSQQQNAAITHLNHAPRAIKNITDFEMDTDTQPTIDLKKILTDMDVYDPNYFTTDALIFEHAEGNHLTVTVTGSKATIKPGNNWCGEETIYFSATDRSGASATAKVRVNVTGCIEAPTVTSVWPTTDPIISETQDGTEVGTPGSVMFSIYASSPYHLALSYDWAVEDETTRNVYKVSSHNADWTFTAAFDCDFERGNFCVGERTKTYYVTASVTDGTFSVEAKKWYIIVKNVNRKPVLSGIEAFTVTSAGVKTTLTEKTPLNYTVAYGKIIELDVTNKVTDLDLNLKNGTGQDNMAKLSFVWTSSISGSFGYGADVKVGAGTARAPATMALKSGTHVLTVTVTDQNNLTATYSIMIKIGHMSSGPDVPSFDSLTFLAAIITVALIMTYRLRK
jgi:hypothetical protein